jgi:transposase
VILRQRVYEMLGWIPKSEVVKHFEIENISRRTTYSIIKRFEKGLPIEDMPRSGRPSKMDKKTLKKLRKCAENQVGTGQRKLASKLSVSRALIRRNLKKLGLTYKKRERAPKYSQKQLDAIPKKCRKLRRDVTDKNTFIIINIRFVPKEANPPNVPQARPIENFWSILASEVYEGGRAARNHANLARRIRENLKEIDLISSNRL